MRVKDIDVIHETLVTPVGSSKRLGIEGEEKMSDEEVQQQFMIFQQKVQFAQQQKKLVYPAILNFHLK